MKASGTVKWARRGRGPRNASQTEWGGPQEVAWLASGVRAPGWDPRRLRPPSPGTANMATTAGAAWGGRCVTRVGLGIGGRGGRTSFPEEETRAAWRLALLDLFELLSLSFLDCIVDVGEGNSISIFLGMTVSRRKLQTRVATSLIAVASVRQNQGSIVQRWKSRPWGKGQGQGCHVQFFSLSFHVGKGIVSVPFRTDDPRG